MSETLSAKAWHQQTLFEPESTRLNVLVVDPDREHVRVVQQMMDRANFRLVRARKLDAGIACLDSDRIDVVMLDLMVPGMGPLENLVCLSRSHPEVPIVVVTRLDDEEIVDLALQKGAMDYVTKRGLRYDTLIRSLRYAIERQGRQRAEQEVLVVQEKERRRLARELHDGLIQTISAMRLQMQMLAKDLGTRDVAAAATVGRLAEEAQRAIDEVRQISHGLHSIAIEHQSLSDAVRLYAQDLQSHFNLQVDVSGDTGPVDYATKEHLYRVCQECMRNAVRHGIARRIDVGFVRESERLEMEVRDDGRGFDLKHRKSGRGIGLASIRERAALLGGDVVIESRVGAGTTIRVKVPLKHHVHV